MRVFAVMIGALGLYVCVMNYIAVGVSIHNRKRNIDRHVSPVVFLAGILMFASAAILLPRRVWALSFIAFALDHTYPLFVYALFILAAIANRTNPVGINSVCFRCRP